MGGKGGVRVHTISKPGLRKREGCVHHTEELAFPSEESKEEIGLDSHRDPCKASISQAFAILKAGCVDLNSQNFPASVWDYNS